MPILKLPFDQYVTAYLGWIRGGDRRERGGSDENRVMSGTNEDLNEPGKVIAFMHHVFYK